MTKTVCVWNDPNENVFVLIEIAYNALRMDEKPEEAKEMLDNVQMADSYKEAKKIMLEYVDVVVPVVRDYEVYKVE